MAALQVRTALGSSPGQCDGTSLIGRRYATVRFGRVRFTFGANFSNIVTLSAAALWIGLKAVMQSLSKRDRFRKGPFLIQSRILRQAQDASTSSGCFDKLRMLVADCEVDSYCSVRKLAPGLKCAHLIDRNSRNDPMRHVGVPRSSTIRSAETFKKPRPIIDAPRRVSIVLCA